MVNFGHFPNFKFLALFIYMLLKKLSHIVFARKHNSSDKPYHRASFLVTSFCGKVYCGKV